MRERVVVEMAERAVVVVRRNWERLVGVGLVERLVVAEVM